MQGKNSLFLANKGLSGGQRGDRVGGSIMVLTIGRQIFMMIPTLNRNQFGGYGYD